MSGDEKNESYYEALIEKELHRFKTHITRIEVHLSGQNGKKEGKKEMHCMLEARLEGRQPIAVSDQAATIKQALSGAINKLKASLETVLGRLANH